MVIQIQNLIQRVRKEYKHIMIEVDDKTLMINTHDQKLLFDLQNTVSRYGYTIKTGIELTEELVKEKTLADAQSYAEMIEQASGELFQWEIDKLFDIEIDSDTNTLSYCTDDDDSIYHAIQLQHKQPTLILKPEKRYGQLLGLDGELIPINRLGEKLIIDPFSDSSVIDPEIMRLREKDKKLVSSFMLQQLQAKSKEKNTTPEHLAELYSVMSKQSDYFNNQTTKQNSNKERKVYDDNMMKIHQLCGMGA